MILKQFGEIADLFEAGFGTVIDKVFSATEWAEDEIDKAKARNPELEDTLDKMFKWLKPSDILMEILVEPTYRSHCREMLNRVVRDGKIDKNMMALPTSAEMCIAFCIASQRAPLKNDYALAYIKCFVGAFGMEKALDLFVGRPYDEIMHGESHKGAVDDLITETRLDMTKMELRSYD